MMTSYVPAGRLTNVVGGGMILSLTIKSKGGLVPDTDTKEIEPSPAPSQLGGIHAKLAEISGSTTTVRSRMTMLSQPLAAVSIFSYTPVSVYMESPISTEFPSQMMESIA